ncbi:MAG: vitamin B12 dependent-methionine synthase activation domain-containing protein [Bacteroidota bacterium]|jgi:hypothetical protein
MMEIVIPQVEREKDIFEVKINFRDLTVSKSEIVSTLGYVDSAIPLHFEEMIDDILSRLPSYCEIKAGYRLLDIKKSEERNDGLFVGSKFFKLQKIVASQLRKSEKAALFICTIGSAMETWAKKLSAEGDAALSYLVDTVASVTEEQTTDVLHDHIEKQMQMQGLKITNRYSPGYCDWSVSEQHLLFSFFPVNFCGITLTESALMVPIKSVSGIIGVGKTVKRVGYTCDLCGMKDCTYRAKRIAKAERANY